MVYSEKLKGQLEEVFAEEIKRGKALDKAEEIIKDYFSRLEKDLKDITPYTQGQVRFIWDYNDIIRFQIGDCFIDFKRDEENIHIRVNDKQVGAISEHQGRPVTMPGRYELDDASIGKYLERAFDKEFSR